MARKTEDIRKAIEFNSLFLELNESRQESALFILQALKFSQSRVCLQKYAVHNCQQSNYCNPY